MPSRAEALVNGIDRLVTLPAIYFQIKRVIESPNSSIIDIARTISTDAALTARLLKIVNSPLYSQSRPVETVSRAVSMLGMNQIHDLSLAACLASAFKSIPPSRMDMAKYWRNSLRRAVAARDLARTCGVMDRERLFVQGLLSDVGHMVMYLRIPEAAAEMLDLAISGKRPLYIIERERLDCDWGQVGAALLKAWGLPPGIHEAIAGHADPKAYQPHALESALLHLVSASIWAEEFGLDIDGLIVPDAWSITGLSREQLAESIEESHDNAKPILSLFLGQDVLAA